MTLNVMTANLNGWNTREDLEDKGPSKTLHRCKVLKNIIRKHKINLFGAQEHHFRTHAEATNSFDRFAPNTWEYNYTLSTTERSGTVTFWKVDTWKLISQSALTSRISITVLQDVEGEEWTIINGHFSNNPKDRITQWDKIHRFQGGQQRDRTILLADHNSILNPHLDSTQVSQESITVQMSRDKEINTMIELGLQDAWSDIYRGWEAELSKDRDEEPVGFTRGHRRIDRISLSTDVLQYLTGIYTIPVGGSDHKSVIGQLSRQNKEHKGRWTIPQRFIDNKKFHEELCGKLRRINHLKSYEWWEEMENILQRLVKDWKARENSWDTETQQIQRAVRDSTTQYLSAAAQVIVKKQGWTGTPGKIYARLVRSLEDHKTKIQEEEVRTLLKNELNEYVAGQEYQKPKRHRYKQIFRLIHQMTRKKPPETLIDKRGRLCIAEEEISKAQLEYWEDIFCQQAATQEECSAYIDTLPMPGWHKGAARALWKGVDTEQAQEAIRDMDGGSAPGCDGIPASIYKKNMDIFAPKIMEVYETMTTTGHMPDNWSRGMMRCLPKVPGTRKVTQQRPIMLLNTKTKWITAILKYSFTDILKIIIPTNQKGFVPKRRMDDLLMDVIDQYNKNEDGIWISLDFAKAFDSLSHNMIRAYLSHLDIPPKVIDLLDTYMKGPVHILVNQTMTQDYINPTSGIRQGDTLSPSIFSLVTTLLVYALKRRTPTTMVHLYADDTLCHIKGTRDTQEREVSTILETMHEYHRYTGLRVNGDKSACITQGRDTDQCSGIAVTSSFRYLGIQLGIQDAEKQYMVRWEAFTQRLTRLSRMGLTDQERAILLKVWIYPIYSVIATIFHIPQSVSHRMDQAVKQALGLKPWTITMTLLAPSRPNGGVAMALPSKYMAYMHSRTYVRYMKDESKLPAPCVHKYQEWDPQARTRTRKGNFMINYSQPRKHDWPILASSSKSFAVLTHQHTGGTHSREDILDLPLWDNIWFTKRNGQSYKCKALERTDILTVRDIVVGEEINERHVRRMAKTWMELYRETISSLLIATRDGEWTSEAHPPPDLDIWSMASAATPREQINEREQRQNPEVWKAMDKVRLSDGIEDFCRRLLWKKLPIAKRLADHAIIPSPRCPLCPADEDHHHITKTCPYLNDWIELVRKCITMTVHENKIQETSRLVSDIPELALQTQSGIFMLIGIKARWLHRCAVLYQREEPTRHQVMANAYSIINRMNQSNQTPLHPGISKLIIHGVQAYHNKVPYSPKPIPEEGIYEKKKKRQREDTQLDGNSHDKVHKLDVQTTYACGQHTIGVILWYGAGHGYNKIVITLKREGIDSQTAAQELLIRTISGEHPKAVIHLTVDTGIDAANIQEYHSRDTLTIIASGIVDERLSDILHEHIRRHEQREETINEEVRHRRAIHTEGLAAVDRLLGSIDEERTNIMRVIHKTQRDKLWERYLDNLRHESVTEERRRRRILYNYILKIEFYARHTNSLNEWLTRREINVRNKTELQEAVRRRQIQDTWYPPQRVPQVLRNLKRQLEVSNATNHGHRRKKRKRDDLNPP